MRVEIEMYKDYPVLTAESLKAIESVACPKCGAEPMMLAEGTGWDTSRLYCIVLTGGCGYEDVLVDTCSDCKGKGCEECDGGLIEVTTYPREYVEGGAK